MGFVKSPVFRKELPGDDTPRGSTWPLQNPNLQPDSSVSQASPRLHGYNQQPNRDHLVFVLGVTY